MNLHVNNSLSSLTISIPLYSKETNPAGTRVTHKHRQIPRTSSPFLLLPGELCACAGQLFVLEYFLPVILIIIIMLFMKIFFVVILT